MKPGADPQKPLSHDGANVCSTATNTKGNSVKMWTPTISERQVETIVEHKEGIDNYPEPGTRIIARLGQTVQHGTVQKQYTNSTRFMAFQVDGVRTGQQLLWFSDGWTFELKDDEQDDSSRA